MLEPNEQVVGKEDELKIRQIGRPIFARDFADGAPFLEFSNHKFCSRSSVVEFPNVDRQETEIGDDDLIGIALGFEQRQLPRWFFRDRPSNDNETSGLLPTGKPEHKRSGFQPGTVTTIPKTADSIFDRWRHFGDNGVGGSFPLEKIEYFLIEECRVGSNRDFSDVLGKFRPSSFQERDGERSWMGISGQPFGFPCNTRLAFETKQRRERGAPPFLRIVSNLGFLLVPVHRQHACIEVENRRLQICQTSFDPIVKTEEPENPMPSQSRQKSAKTRGVGIASKTRQILKYAVLPQQAGHFDSSKPQENWIEKGQNYFSESVSRVPFPHLQGVCQAASESQPLKKSLKQQQTAKVRQGVPGKTYADFSACFGHWKYN